MLRSQINTYISQAINFFKEMKWNLPPFAFWELEKWNEIISDPKKKKMHSQIIYKNLGWDVTDFGEDDFQKSGLVLFTMRNGKVDSIRTYAEKIMMVRENQITPFHYHRKKCEDIINRGGGNLIVKLFNASPKDKFKRKNEWQPGIFERNESIRFRHDGLIEELKAGSKIRLLPGESITIYPRIYHSFYGEENSGNVLVGEISMVNDDDMDNRFYYKLPRFSEIEYDEFPVYILADEYGEIPKLMKLKEISSI